MPSRASIARMNALARLPVFFLLEGRRVVVAGGNAAAAWKVELLSACGAHVDVFAEAPCDELRDLANAPVRGAVVIHNRIWTAHDLIGTALVVGAFERDELAANFAASGHAAGVPVNVIDKPAFCDFSFGSIVNRSPLVIGISTDGAAPVLAQAIRAKFEALLPKGFARWAKAAARWRVTVQGAGLPVSGRREFWRLFTAKAMLEPNRAPSNDDLTALLDEVRDLGPAVAAGSVTLVGAGPGDPELLTLAAVRALQAADVILFDDLVSNDVLDFARREARKLLVGKSGYGPSCKQEDINALMVGLAKQGKRVVRLKGGDPLIFARGAEEIAVCKDAGVAVNVVPGITAAQGAASRLAVALTGRAQARRLQFITGHARGGSLPEDIDWSAIGDPTTTTAIYMPAKTLAALVDKAIEHGLDPQTPAIAVACATRPDQVAINDTICQLPARLAAQALSGPLLVMLGRALAPPDAQPRRSDTRQAVTNRGTGHYKTGE